MKKRSAGRERKKLLPRHRAAVPFTPATRKKEKLFKKNGTKFKRKKSTKNVRNGHAGKPSPRACTNESQQKNSFESGRE